VGPVFESGPELVKKDAQVRGYFALTRFQLACLYAQASVGKTVRDEAPREVSLEEVEENRKKSLTHLEAAFSLGYDNFDKVRRDTDLAPLRREAGFEPLVKKWENR
jgi:hypothetical protein